MPRLRVLYEDNHIIAVHKPAGMLVEPAQPVKTGRSGGADASGHGPESHRRGDQSLFEGVKKYLKEKYKKPGNVFLGIVHRLDRPVEGIVLFGKTSKGAARLSEQFREHTIRKIYHAVVLGTPSPAKAMLIHFLTKDERAKVAIVFETSAPGRDKAELMYETVHSNDNYSLLKIKLKTGRFHQIRAQLAHIGHPVAGDVKYGAPEAMPDKTIALAATELEFQKATEEERVELHIEMPAPWRKLVA
ncbi:MAG: RluA family pseudouridine synthase [Patescibacteria group bacterium]